MQSHQSDTAVKVRWQTWETFPLFHWLWDRAGNSTDAGPPVSWGALAWMLIIRHTTHTPLCVKHKLQFFYTKPLWDRNRCPWLSATVTWPWPSRDQEHFRNINHVNTHSQRSTERKMHNYLVSNSSELTTETTLLDIKANFPVGIKIMLSYTIIIKL